MIRSATSTTAPSTHPPDTAPTTSPSSLMPILVPAGCGADFLVSTTVATATRSPRPIQFSIVSSTEFMTQPTLRSPPRYPHLGGSDPRRRRRPPRPRTDQGASRLPCLHGG